MTISELRDRGVTVKSLTENFDLSAKEGQFMFAVLTRPTCTASGKLAGQAQAVPGSQSGACHVTGWLVAVGR